MTEKNSRSAWNHLRREDFNDVLQSELTKAEFGEALGLTQKSTFLESIFNLADVDKSGSISFQEFLDLSVRFYDGNCIISYCFIHTGTRHARARACVRVCARVRVYVWSFHGDKSLFCVWCLVFFLQQIHKVRWNWYLTCMMSNKMGSWRYLN